MKHARWVFEAIGTRWDVACVLPEHVHGAVYEAMRERIECFDKNYSRFRSDSLVHAISLTAGTYDMPEDWEPLWNTYHTLYRLTGGAFTPAVGFLLEDLGYDAAYSFVKKPARRVASLEEIVTSEGRTLRVTAPVLLDFGAVGKGYLIDIVAELLAAHGARKIVIDAGGDILSRAPEPLRVGLEDPDDTARALGVIEITNESICGSAGNRRRWRDMHHIVHPETHAPISTISAVWTVAGTAREADALSTALFFTEPEKILKDFSFEWVRLRADRSAEFSQRFAGTLFTPSL